MVIFDSVNNDMKGNGIMGRIGRFAFIKITLFCLVSERKLLWNHLFIPLY